MTTPSSLSFPRARLALDCVTIADDMCEEKGMHDILEAMLDAVELNSIQHDEA